MERELADVGWWFDTSDIDPIRTADTITRLAPVYAVVPPPPRNAERPSGSRNDLG